MPRNAARGQPSLLGRRARALLRRVSLLVLVVVCLVLTAADEPRPARPTGLSAARSVAMALELALLADNDWDATPGSLDEARALLQRSDLEQDQVRELALEAAGRWSGRSEPARRLFAAWARAEQADQRMEMLDDEGAVGQLARMGLVAEFCGALAGSTHLPPAQAAGLLARSAATHDSVHALERVGKALEGIQPTTLLGAHQLVSWRALLAVARVPGTVEQTRLPQAQGLPLERPAAPLLRVEPERIILSSPSLVSWSSGRLVVDAGPPAEILEGWSPSAWLRSQAIARRRSELSLAGVTALLPADAHRDVGVFVPSLSTDPDLPLARLVQVLSWLQADGVQQACLLVREAEHQPVRQVCAPFRADVPAGGATWSLGPGGLYSDQLPGVRGTAWAVAQPGARVEDLVLALEEARHAGRSVGLVATGSD